MIHDLGLVLVILSIGSIIGPVVLGFSMWKMTRVFVSKDEFAEYRSRATEERHEASRQLERIADNVNMLLQRVARLQGRTNHTEEGGDR